MPWGGVMSAHPLSGSVVAVVGASGALGSRIARGAADRGAHVVLVGRDEQRLRGLLEGVAARQPGVAQPGADGDVLTHPLHW